MECYDWYTVREALKRLQVKSGWLSSSNLLGFVSPNGVGIIRKDNRIRPETIQFLLDELDITTADFEKAYRTIVA